MSNDGLIIEIMDLSHIYLAVKTQVFCVDSQSKTFKLKKTALTGSKQTTHERNIKQHPYKECP